MRSSRRRSAGIACIALLAGAAWTGEARAQQGPLSLPTAPGFALERLYLSAPGAGWFVMDDLGMHGGLGAAASLTTSYAHDPLRVRSTDGAQRLAVVTDEAMANVGLAATYLRWRVSLGFDMPLALGGSSGAVGAYQFTAPHVGTPFTPSGVNVRSTPDTMADARVGVEARLVGEPGEAFRLGLGAQLWISTPNEDPSEYLTDGTLRAMGRVLVAGDVRWLTYAAQVGVHVRPTDDGGVGGAPQGSELLFGGAAGARTWVDRRQALGIVVGPEVFGATALGSPFGGDTTEAEALLTGRLERARGEGLKWRVKLGMGGGLDPKFGAPEWRAVVGVEIWDHTLGKIGK